MNIFLHFNYKGSRYRERILKQKMTRCFIKFRTARFQENLCKTILNEEVPTNYKTLVTELCFMPVKSSLIAIIPTVNCCKLNKHSIVINTSKISVRNETGIVEMNAFLGCARENGSGVL